MGGEKNYFLLDSPTVQLVGKRSVPGTACLHQQRTFKARRVRCIKIYSVLSRFVPFLLQCTYTCICLFRYKDVHAAPHRAES